MLAVLVFDGAEARRARARVPARRPPHAFKRARALQARPEAAAEVGGAGSGAQLAPLPPLEGPARRTPAAAILVMSDGPPPPPDRLRLQQG